jgi:trehalose 6-phosphate phosphatase
MSAAAAGKKNNGWFFEALAGARRRVLFLDYDGTVAPFSSDRSSARPYASVPPMLRQIMTTCSTRLIIVSGRSAREIPRLMPIHPGPEIWGSHGVERLYSDGRYEEREVTDEALQALADAEFGLDEASLGPYIEVKLAAIAVHWRGLDAASVVKIRLRAYRVLEPFTLRADLVLREFDEGVELRLRSANKGDALRTFLSDLSATVPVAYVGDDVDDERAFQTLNGRGLTVLVRPEPRFTSAQVVLRPPEELIAFLKDWIQACGGTACADANA